MLATTEVQQLLDEEGLALASLPEAAFDLTAAGTSGEEHPGDGVYGYPGGAGGYLEFVFRCGQSSGSDSGWTRGLCVNVGCVRLRIMTSAGVKSGMR